MLPINLIRNLIYNYDIKMLKNSIKYIVVIFILYTLWAIGIPLLFKLNVNNIENLIQKASGYKIEIVNPRLNLWTPPYIEIKAETFKILNKDSTNALSIENPKINIKIDGIAEFLKPTLS